MLQYLHKLQTDTYNDKAKITVPTSNTKQPAQILGAQGQSQGLS